jgi:hypothetical protein
MKRLLYGRMWRVYFRAGRTVYLRTRRFYLFHFEYRERHLMPYNFETHQSVVLRVGYWWAAIGRHD